MSELDPNVVAALVREVMRELGPKGEGKATPGPKPVTEAPVGWYQRARRSGWRTPFSPTALRALKAATPARLAQGRTGTRYLTDTYIQLRAEHAIALDAVHSVVPQDLALQLGCVMLESRATDREEFLLYPANGRRLSDRSRDVLLREASRGVDVQIVCGDGLSAWALVENGPVLVPALQRELGATGFSVGRPLFVTFARVGVQDEIGVLTGAKSTIILVGERPGLGTGDSLSIYSAYGPKLDQDNAEKDCISNIRPLGIPPEEAAKECAELLHRTFKAGCGGVGLTRSGR